MEIHRHHIGQALLLYVAAFASAYWIVVHPAAVMRSAAPAVAERSPMLFGFFAFAVVVAIILVKKVQTKHFWNLFYSVVAGVGILIALYYAIVGIFPTAVATVVAIVLSVALVLTSRAKSTIWLHNAVAVLASVGVARLFGVQLLPQGMILVGTVLATYTVIATYFSGHLFSAAQALFAEQALFGAVLTDHITQWRQPRVRGSEQSQQTLGAGDISFPVAIAISYLFYGSPLLFFVVAGATCIGVCIVHLVRLQHKPLPALPVLIGCCFIAIYTAVQFLS
jgi:presenilin-like A22 family membrane protease